MFSSVFFTASLHQAHLNSLNPTNQRTKKSQHLLYLYEYQGNKPRINTFFSTFDQNLDVGLKKRGGGVVSTVENTAAEAEHPSQTHKEETCHGSVRTNNKRFIRTAVCVAHSLKFFSDVKT